MDKAEGKKGENEDESYLYVKNLDTGEDVSVSDALNSFSNFSVADSKDVHPSDFLREPRDGDEYEDEADDFRSDDELVFTYFSSSITNCFKPKKITLQNRCLLGTLTQAGLTPWLVPHSPTCP